jgi:Bacterial toxin YdaS
MSEISKFFHPPRRKTKPKDSTHCDEPVQRLRVNGRDAIVTENRMNALQKAIDRAGGPSAFARKVGVSRQSIWNWKRVPTHRIIQVEWLTGVPREELRPDLYRPRKQIDR